MQKYVAEGIGTFFLILIIALSGNPLAIGLGLAALVYMTGHISGAHLNPAVTFAMWQRGATKRKEVNGYWISQLIGAFLAALVIVLLGVSFMPAPSISIWQAFIIEALFTFVLAIVILTVATSKALKGNHVYGLVIGLTLGAIVYAGASLSGAVYNPAVALGPMLFSVIVSGTIAVPHALLYIAAPLVGGYIAAIVFKYLNPKG